MPVSIKTQYTLALKAFVEKQNKINILDDRIIYYEKEIVKLRNQTKIMGKEVFVLATKVTQMKEKLDEVKE